MRLQVTTTLGCLPERVWNEVLTSRLLEYVTRPFASYKPVRPVCFPSIWSEGPYVVQIRLFGILPFGKHTIAISIPNPKPEGVLYAIRDNGFGDVITKWDHVISIRASHDGRTVYRDTVEIKAGLLTPFVWAYAFVFYHYRQYRWRKLVASDFNYSYVRQVF